MKLAADPRRSLAFTDIPPALVELTRFAISIRFRVRGRYWAWRMHTALGSDPSGTPHKARAAIEFGRWIGMMRKIAVRPAPLFPVASERSR